MSGDFRHSAAALVDAVGRRSGLVRGPDRKVRRHCVDENDEAAKPWRHNRFTSTQDRLATLEALIDVATLIEARGREKFPRGRLKDLRNDLGAAETELAELLARPVDARPIGRPAALRMTIDHNKALLAEAKMRLTASDHRIFGQLLGWIRKDGVWYPAAQTVASAANKCAKSFYRAIKRLAHHGLLAFIPRSRRVEGNAGHFAPQREQTSHAYHLDPRRMQRWLYERFLQLRAKRFARIRPGPGRDRPGDSAKATNLPLREALASLEATVVKRDGHGVLV